MNAFGLAKTKQRAHFRHNYALFCPNKKYSFFTLSKRVWFQTTAWAFLYLNILMPEHSHAWHIFPVPHHSTNTWGCSKKHTKVSTKVQIQAFFNSLERNRQRRQGAVLQPWREKEKKNFGENWAMMTVNWVGVFFFSFFVCRSGGVLHHMIMSLVQFLHRKRNQCTCRVGEAYCLAKTAGIRSKKGGVDL